LSGRPQRTLKGIASIEGVGLHTGETGVMRFLPAPVGHGVRFVRTDLPGQPEVRVRPENAHFDPGMAAGPSSSRTACRCTRWSTCWPRSPGSGSTTSSSRPARWRCPRATTAARRRSRGRSCPPGSPSRTSPPATSR
jgi:hypothetical protein